MPRANTNNTFLLSQLIEETIKEKTKDLVKELQKSFNSTVSFHLTRNFSDLKKYGENVSFLYFKIKDFDISIFDIGLNDSLEYTTNEVLERVFDLIIWNDLEKEFMEHLTKLGIKQFESILWETNKMLE